MTPRIIALALALFTSTTAPVAAQKTDKAAPATKKDSGGKVQEVIVEGVGKTIEDALKEAYRAAVRQVVGAVVDEETQLKNDAIISDKVVTASGGFVTSYKQLNKEESNGLIRIRIKATVEKAELVDKLRECKITIREIDTGKIFPKAEDQRFSDERIKLMTKEDMVANKTEIIQDVLVDLPKVLEARAKDLRKFDFDADKSTLSVEVQLLPDNERYVQLLKRLQLRLDKLALRKVVAVVDGAARDLTWSNPDRTNATVRGYAAICQSLNGTANVDLQKEPDAWTLWVMTDVLKGGASTRWAGYVMDTDPRNTFAGLHGTLSVQVALRDANGKSVTEDSFEPLEPWLGVVMPRSKAPAAGWPRALLLPWEEGIKVTQERTVNAVISPLPVTGFLDNNRPWPYMEYALVRPYARKIRIEKEELQRVKDIRCAVQFRPEK